MNENMIAVIMAGGTGKRFWPLSRQHRPKQVLNVAGGQTMLGASIERLLPVVPAERIYVITASQHEEPVREVCSQLPAANILGEPEGRDTAACAGLGGVVAREVYGPETVIGVFPADHRIEPAEKFQAAVSCAAAASAELDSIVTFGIRPDFPSTGYGYIQYDKTQSKQVAASNLHPVKRFTEKPDRASAEKFLEESGYLWNSGMFFWTAERILTEIEQHMPKLAEGLENIATDWRKTSSWSEALAGNYSRLPALSVDYGILEKAQRIWTLPVDFEWNDLGTWDALKKLFNSDASGNVELGKVLSVDSENSFVFNEGGPFVGVVGLEDHIVVATGDAVLVCPSDRCEEVKKLVNSLEEEHPELL